MIVTFNVRRKRRVISSPLVYGEINTPTGQLILPFFTPKQQPPKIGLYLVKKDSK